jgi:hypothetical protein
MQYSDVWALMQAVYPLLWISPIFDISLKTLDSCNDLGKYKALSMLEHSDSEMIFMRDK